MDSFNCHLLINIGTIKRTEELNGIKRQGLF
jgi:hypothetical protein